MDKFLQAWSEQHRYATSKKRLECTIPLKKRQRRTRLPNTVTLDSVYEKNFLSQSSVLEAVVVDAFVLPGAAELFLFFFIPGRIVCNPDFIFSLAL